MAQLVQTLFGLVVLGAILWAIGSMMLQNAKALVRADKNGVVRSPYRGKTIYRSADPKRFARAKVWLAINVLMLAWPLLIFAFVLIVLLLGLMGW